MSKPHGDRIAVLALFLVGSMAAAAHARAEDLRCAGTNIVAGSRVRQVLDRCGRPAYVERRATLRTQLLEGSGGERRIAYREEALEVWAYRSDEGSLQMVTIRKGQVSEIKTIAVVGPSITDDSQSCTPGKLYEGASTAEIFLACGQPNDRQRMVTTTTKRVDDVEYRELITVERWTYASRRERLRQVLEFENGELKVVTAG